MAQATILTAFLASLAGGGAVSGSICGHQLTTVGGLIHDLMERDGGEIILTSEKLVSIKDTARQRVWSIGRLANAMPVVICREVVKAGERYRIDLHAVCAGPEHECAAFIDGFRN